jgi:hypothetical protein
MAFPLVLALSGSVAASVKAFTNYKKIKNFFSSAVDDIYSATSKHKEEIATGVAGLTALAVAEENDLISNIPAYNLLPDSSITNPVDFVDYLKLQSDNIKTNTLAQENVSKQVMYNNELIAKNIKKVEEARIESEALRNMLDGYLASFLVQFQELSKIPASMSMLSEVDVAYADQKIENEYTLNEKIASLSEQLAIQNELLGIQSESPSVTVNNTTDTVALDTLSTALTEQTSKLEAIKTNLDAVSQNAVKQKEIAEYMTETQSIRNLDGNEVAVMKPIEAQAVKNIVDAKNATDEMEFELPDDILDFAYSTIPLPTFNYVNHNQDLQNIVNEMRSL